MKKLVRDRIPELYPTNTYYTANQTEYLERLGHKLLEEVHEFLAAQTPEHRQEELADILEVLDALYTAHNFNPADIQAIKTKKQSERGAFKNKIILDLF